MDIQKYIELANSGMFDQNHPTEQLYYQGNYVCVDKLLVPLI